MDEAKEKAWQRRQAKLARIRQQNIDNFISAALSRPEGRDFFYWLLEICHMGITPFTGNALTTAFQCGEENIGKIVQAQIIQVAPEAYFQMLRDREKERLNAPRSDDDTSDDNDDSASTDD